LAHALSEAPQMAGIFVEAQADELPVAALASRLSPSSPARLRLLRPASRPLGALLDVLEHSFEILGARVEDACLCFDLARKEPGQEGLERAPLDRWALAEAVALATGEALAKSEEALDAEIQASVRRLGEEAKRRKLEVSGLRGDVTRLRGELAEIRRSTRYRLAHALVLAARPGKDTLRLPRRVLNLVQDRRRPPRDRADDGRARVRDRLLHDLERFAAYVRTGGHSHVVFMLSGTTFVQPLRANRPIRLTRILRERQVPVLFSFHGKLSDPDIPSNEQDPGLCQIPIELTETLIETLPAMDFGPTRRVFMVSYPHPSVMKTLGRFAVSGWATLYDCRDDWEAFSEVGAAEWYDPAVERFVVGQCDRSFAVSWPLRDKIRAFAPHRKIETSPNAYDPAFLSPDYAREPDGNVVIGYFGHLTPKWFDWPALARVARARPEWQFEIIGHQGPQNPGTPDNVALLGPKTHPEICDYARRWRAAIIPFRPSVLADAVDPIMIYEYFGLGLPVVSFRMPQIDSYPHTRTVETPEAFVEALEAALAEPVDPQALSAFLAENTWAHRVDQLMGAADEILDRPPFEKYLGAIS
ncbi:MAG: hypothetical protein AAFU79_24095, partial [Myxococcota bacterium]